MAKKVNALHEILAVIGDLKGAKDKIHNETLKTFRDKPAHFLGSHKKLKMFDESRAGEQTDEHKALVTNVVDKLGYMKRAFIRCWDAKLQKESGNQLAKADIIIDDATIASDIPVTLLLEMENEIKELRKVYEAIPTLAPGIDWVEAKDIGENIHKSQHPVVSNKTEKNFEHKVLVPATDRHPAQVREWTEDKPVGQYSTIQWSGMLTSADKSVLLAKIDKVSRAIKRARQRANKQEITKAAFGAAIFDFIHSK